MNPCLNIVYQLFWCFPGCLGFWPTTILTRTGFQPGMWQRRGQSEWMSEHLDVDPRQVNLRWLHWQQLALGPAPKTLSKRCHFPHDCHWIFAGSRLCSSLFWIDQGNMIADLALMRPMVLGCLWCLSLPTLRWLLDLSLLCGSIQS